MATLEAVVEIGSTAIRLMAFEVREDTSWKILDKSELPVALGKDVFTTGAISRDTLLQCIRILTRFKEQLSSWCINNEHLAIIGTSAVRSAKNRDTFIDRIFIKTGCKVKIIDGIEENSLMYLGVLHILKTDAPRVLKQNAVILDIGGGSTELMILQHGKMAAAHSLGLGTVIIAQNIKSTFGSLSDARRFLEDYIKNASGNMSTETDFSRVKQFITLGADTQLAAKEAGTKIGKKTWSIARDSFFGFTHQIQEYSVEECIAKFKISYNEANSLTVSLLTYKLFMELTAAEEMIVLDVSVREGLLINRISAPDDLHSLFYSQVIASALAIGKKYSFDEKHAKYVRDAALKIYDEMQSELGLEDECRMLLEVAALLHDIGVFIRSSDHHLHSQYILSHSDIFGLGKDSMKIISMVARYHRETMRLPSDELFLNTPRSDRTKILKLAAILRIADALDRGHSQYFKNFSLELKDETIIIHLKDTHNINLEKLAVSEKSDLFESVFGYSISII